MRLKKNAMKDFIVVAHRGGEGPHPENSLEAFQHAIQHGSKAIELDLRFDYLGGRFFVEHDFFHPLKKRQNVIDKLVPALPKGILIFAEIKTISCLTNYLAKKTLKTFEKLFDPERTIVISFNPFILMRLRKLAPKMELGFLCGKIFWNFLFQKWFYRSIKPSVYLLHRRLLSKKNVGFGEKHGMKVMAFVLNQEVHLKEAMALGVDGIVTDFPAELQKKI